MANQKGGVGKTTTAINLGTALAAIGEAVLIVDLDPQGNASTGLGIDRQLRNTSTYDVLDRRGARCATPSCRPRCRASISRASTMDLSGLELELGASATAPSACATPSGRSTPNGATDTISYVLVDARRRSIFSPSMQWRPPMRFWCRCNASSSRSRACRG